MHCTSAVSSVTQTSTTAPTVQKQFSSHSALLLCLSPCCAFSGQCLVRLRTSWSILAFYFQRTTAPREKWARALLLSLHGHCCSSLFPLLPAFSPLDSYWEAGGLATSTLLLAVHYFQMWFLTPLFVGLVFFFHFLSQVCSDGSGSHALASHPQSAEQQHPSLGRMQRLLSPALHCETVSCHNHRG